jgi:NADH-quinone oxidoreductase subunit L
MLTTLWLIPLVPLLGFLALAGSQGEMGRAATAWIGTGSVGIAAALAGWMGYEFLAGPYPVIRVPLWHWIQIPGFSAGFGLTLDALSLNLVWVVTGVGLLIHLYSVGFMADDPDYARFFAYLNLFVAAMLILVLADNLVLLYLGWEGVGLCSYLLIGFWYENPDNGAAARKAFVMTRVGDTALLLGLLLIFTEIGSLDIHTVLGKAPETWPKGSDTAVWAAALVLGGALGKSAQLPLQSWLPDAMAGPTPISALIHAATMVTAGVYLIARLHPLFELAPDVLATVAAIGTLTLLMAGASALVQRDIKRILAYSTISQIGYMFLGLGVGAYSAAIFHLTTHAFFKALLFLAAGAVIHAFHHEQDIFRLGGLRHRLPLAFWSFLIGTAALAALPYTSGYYSKHDILAAAAQAHAGLWAAGTLGALLTGLYGFRLVFVAFFGPENPGRTRPLGLAMTLSLILLGALALFGGWAELPLEPVFPSREPVPLGLGLGMVTELAPLLGVGLAALFYLTGTFSPARLARTDWGSALQRLWLSGWGFDGLYGMLLVQPFRWLAEANRSDVLDDVFRGIAWLSGRGHRALAATQTGRLRWYAAGLAGGAVLAVAFGVLS